MLHTPITINDYSNPIDCVQKNIENENKVKLQFFKKKLANKVNQNVITRSNPKKSSIQILIRKHHILKKILRKNLCSLK